jgi:hypothetical protein
LRLGFNSRVPLRVQISAAVSNCSPLTVHLKVKRSIEAQLNLIVSTNSTVCFFASIIDVSGLKILQHATSHPESGSDALLNERPTWPPAAETGLEARYQRANR